MTYILSALLGCMIKQFLDKFWSESIGSAHDELLRIVKIGFTE